MGLLRHGAMDVLFGGVRAPSTFGSHLRCYAWETCCRSRRPAGTAGLALARGAAAPGADVLAFIDIDSTQKRVYGHKKQGARFGHTKIQGKSVLVRGLNALITAVSTPLAAPAVAATRLRGGTRPHPAARRAWPRRPSAPPRLRLHRDHRGADGLCLLCRRRDRRHPP